MTQQKSGLLILVSFIDRRYIPCQQSCSKYMPKCHTLPSPHTSDLMVLTYTTGAPAYPHTMCLSVGTYFRAELNQSSGTRTVIENHLLLNSDRANLK